ncbi:salicylate hydroxylase [Coprinopsis marcescibilis]|uniref:Salicylate hydroxylase n=1 Tax=Coprinopsis marcescibilis TaxID=230819 RepID=A0A5C3L983_COPMA|nr:salicylate hydroxylase [Coprinopsis marcescibilis]
MSSQGFKQLRVAVVGGGIGGLSAGLALRRAGHLVEIFERRGFDVEVGASISCAANGSVHLEDWGVDVSEMSPVNLMKLTMRDWDTGEVQGVYDLSGYEKEWGRVYFMLHRQDMHKVLLKTAISEEGAGTPCKIVNDSICESVDLEAGIVKFTNGKFVQADLIIGADGIRSVVREQIGVVPDIKSSPQTCYRCNVLTKDIKELGLVSHSYEPAIQFWGGNEGRNGRSKYYKIVMAPCSSGEVVSFYCFMPTEMTNHREEGFAFKECPVSDILKGRYSELDPNCLALLKSSRERMPWRLYVHQPYTHWVNKQTCLLGDAAHPMMPHQSQGACQAIEDAGALGIIFSSKYPEFTRDVEAGLRLYQAIRKPRATMVQAASARATDNVAERIGFTSIDIKDEMLRPTDGSLTVKQMNEYNMHHHVAAEVSKLRKSQESLHEMAHL